MAGCIHDSLSKGCFGILRQPITTLGKNAAKKQTLMYMIISLGIWGGKDVTLLVSDDYSSIIGHTRYRYLVCMKQLELPGYIGTKTGRVAQLQQFQEV